MENATETNAPTSLEDAAQAILIPDEPSAESEEIEATAEIDDGDDADESDAPADEQTDDEDEGESTEESDEDDDGEEPESDESDDEDGSDEVDESDQEESAQLHTVTVDGKEEQVTLDDLKRGYSGQKYVQKGMQEAAAARKQAEDVYAALTQERQQLTQLFQQVQQGGLQAPPVPPSAEMASTDPIGFIEAKAKYDEDIAAYNQQMGQMQQIMQQQSDAQKRAQEEYARQEMQQLLKAVPEFSDKAKAKELYGELVNGGGEYYGYSAEEIGGVLDHRAIQVLNDAIKYRKMQAKRSIAERKAQKAKPVIKPGAKKRRGNPNADAKRKAHDKLKRSGKIDDAVALIMEM